MAKKFPIRFPLWLRTDQREALRSLALYCNQSEGEVVRTALYRHANSLRKADENGDIIKFPLDRSDGP